MEVQESAEPLRPEDPATVGPYALLGRLGEGGMGTVYLAKSSGNRLVAIKVIRPAFTIDEGFTARFHDEVANARRVASFCTAQVLDDGVIDGSPYMVTEYIQGIPLARQIARFGALEAGTLHGVALGVAAALTAIHVAGLVHRDLKPANVILSMSGPRVIDFGIARALDATHGYTPTGTFLGSPGWWAPEQVLGRESTPAVDVFAWGCLVAYSGNGRHPYGQGDALTLAARVLHADPDLGSLPPPLGDLVTRAMQQEPDARPTAQDLLLGLVGGSPAARPDAVVATQMVTETWQPPENVAALAATPGTATAPVPEHVLFTQPGQLAQEPEPTQPELPILPPPPPDRPGRRLLVALAAGGVALAAVLGLLLVPRLLTDRPAGNATVRPTATVAASVPPDAPLRVIDAGRVVSPSSTLVVRRPRAVAQYKGKAATSGRVFCLLGISLHNTGSKEVPAFSFKGLLLQAGNASYSPHGLSDHDELGQPLSPGELVTGYLVFEIPQGATPTGLEMPRSGDLDKKIEIRL